MKTRSRLLAIILTLVLVLALLSGCAGDGGEVATTEAAAVTNIGGSNATEPPQEKVFFPLDETMTITYWFRMESRTAYDDPNNGYYFKELQNRTNVAVDFTLVAGGGMSESFSTMQASGDFTDVVYSGQTSYTGGPDAAIEEGAYVALNGLLEDYAPDYLAAINRYGVMKDVTTGGGNIVAFFALQEGLKGPTSGMSIRKDWLDTVNMEVPTTYSELTDVITAFKTELGVEYPMPMHFTGVYTSNSLVSGYDVWAATAPGRGIYPFYPVNGDITYGLTSKGYKEYLTMVAQWYADGLITPDFALDTENSDTADELILNGKVGLMHTTDTMITDFEMRLDDAEIVPMPMTKQEKGQQLHMSALSIVNSSYHVVISQNADDAGKTEVICRWLNYNYTDEGALLFNYGVEDVSFEYVDGKPLFTELVTNNPDGLVLGDAMVLYANGYGPSLLNLERLYQSTSEAVKSASTQWLGGDDGAYAFPVFASMTAEESSEFSRLYADIKTYVDESRLRFITGARSLSEWDAYVAEIENMNIARAIEIKQDAYDRYLSK